MVNVSIVFICSDEGPLPTPGVLRNLRSPGADGLKVQNITAWGEALSEAPGHDILNNPFKP